MTINKKQNVNRDFNNKIKKIFQDTDKGVGLIKMNSINELVESYEVDKKAGRLDE